MSRRGPLLLILFAALMAGAGNGISMVAFPWLVLQHTGSALDASVVAMAGTLPLLAATLIAGAAVDFLGRRRVSMISDALSALSVAAVPRSEEHTSELQSQFHLVCRLLLEKKNK